MAKWCPYEREILCTGLSPDVPKKEAQTSTNQKLRWTRLSVEPGRVSLFNTFSFLQHRIINAILHCYCPWLILLVFFASPRGRSQYSSCTEYGRPSIPPAQHLLAFWLLSHFCLSRRIRNSNADCAYFLIAVDSSVFFIWLNLVFFLPSIALVSDWCLFALYPPSPKDPFLW